MFHIELRQFPHSARAFNLEEEQLRREIVAPWIAGHPVEWGERRWSPQRAKLTIISGRALAPNELGMGRGWPEAVRTGEDVTTQVLASAERSDGTPLAALKQALLVRCASTPQPLAVAVEVGGELLPGHRLSERLSVAEQGVWELLHEGKLALHGSAEVGVVPSPPEAWAPLLLAWSSWTDTSGLSLIAVAEPPGS